MGEETRSGFAKSGIWMNLSRSKKAVNVKLADGSVLTVAVTSLQDLLKGNGESGLQFSVFRPDRASEG